MTEPILFPQSPTTTKLKIQTINVTKISVKKNNNIITTTTENNTNLKIFSSLINDNNVRLIDYTEFEDIITLNTECYGLIKKAYWKKEEKYIYLKFINDLEYQLKKINERNNQIIQQSKHENIIQFYGVSQDKEKNNYFLVLQYTNDGSLREYLAKNKENLKWVDKLRLAKDIAAGLKILHDNDIFHGELDDAVSSTTPSYKISVPGIIPYIDPQTFAKRSSPRTHNLQKLREQQQQIKKNDDDEYLNHLKSDIYSLGVVLWEISTNKIPFDDSKNQVVLTVSIMIRNKRELPAEVNAEVNDGVNDKDFLVRDKRSSHMETIGDLTTVSLEIWETPENISMNPSTQLQTKDENSDSKPIPKNILTSKSPCQSDSIIDYTELASPTNSKPRKRSKKNKSKNEKINSTAASSTTKGKCSSNPGKKKSFFRKICFFSIMFPNK
nr:1294_t:CDS:2 [Entrophospora candida]